MQGPFIDVGLDDSDLFARGAPHEVLTRLRTESPVVRHLERGGPGFWTITRHADVVRISKDPETFSSALGTNIFDPPGADLPLLQAILINMDPPQPVKFRRIVKAGFTPNRVQRLEAHVRAIARSVEIGRAAWRG